MSARWRASSCCRIALLATAIFFAANSTAYSVLTHEELIDLAWNDSIRPLLLAKFPGATEHQLKEAHAYAYGGSDVQDMGYYPFGKPFFSNLTHYVRSGDFVLWLLQNARTIDEYAFAIGALSHYLGDSIGHSESINPSTAIEFPKLKAKYGDFVTYGESPHAHIRTEFAFDIEEISDEAFAPPAYLRYIGFKVPRRFLERAFLTTYGFSFHEMVGRSRAALKTYRSSARSFIPAFAEAELLLHRKQFPPPPNDETYRIFSQRVAQTNYERRWQHAYKGPGIKIHLLAIVVFLVPKIGAASDLAIKIPNAETEEWYLRSVNRTVDEFHLILHKLLDPKQRIVLTNLNLDTGERVRLGDYLLADRAYAELLERITAKPQRVITEDLKRNVLEYYEGSASIAEIDDPKFHELLALQEMQTRGR